MTLQDETSQSTRIQGRSDQISIGAFLVLPADLDGLQDDEDALGTVASEIRALRVLLEQDALVEELDEEEKNLFDRLHGERKPFLVLFPGIKLMSSRYIFGIKRGRYRWISISTCTIFQCGCFARIGETSRDNGGDDSNDLPCHLAQYHGRR